MLKICVEIILAQVYQSDNNPIESCRIQPADKIQWDCGVKKSLTDPTENPIFLIEYELVFYSIVETGHIVRWDLIGFRQ
jgi:hypothetical protein